MSLLFIAEPSQPLNVTILRVTSTTIYLSWSQPEKPNGQIQGYRLYYMHAMQTHVRTVRNTTAFIQFELEHLGKWNLLELWYQFFFFINYFQLFRKTIS